MISHTVETSTDFDPDSYEELEATPEQQQRTSYLIFEFADDHRSHKLWLPYQKTHTNLNRLEANEIVMSRYWTESPDWEVERWAEYKKVSFKFEMIDLPDGTTKIDLDYRSYEAERQSGTDEFVRNEGLTQCDFENKNCHPIIDVVWRGSLSFKR
jgi:hypothetical protein